MNKAGQQMKKTLIALTALCSTTFFTNSLLAVASVANATNIASTISVPMHLTNKGHAYVYANIDNVTDYPMVIDTGANSGILPMSIKQQLDLTNKQIETQLVTGGTGELEMQFVTIDQTDIGGETQANVAYLFQDLDKLESKDQLTPGIIGHNYLENYCVEFNFTSKAFKLTPSICPVSTVKGLKSVPFKIQNNFLWTEATFKDTKVDVLLDTGAHHSFINTTLLNRLDDVKKGQKESFSALTNHEQERTELTGVTYKLGQHQIEEGLMYAADMHVFDVLGYKNKPFLLLGIDYFKQDRLIIDYRNQRLYF